MRQQIIEDIFKIVKLPNPFDALEDKFKELTREELSSELVEVGILPEFFDHDSSEEKIWSKYSDIMLAKSLIFLGLDAEVIRMRGNSADVFAKSKKYTIVGDAKCFRLSRTAKNQKDFKVKALDDWRRADTYALLLSPLYQYPLDRSQIYAQAISRNVTLLSYTHMKLLIDCSFELDLKSLWEVGNKLAKEYTTADQQRGSIYWKEVDKVVCEITGASKDKLTEYKLYEVNKTKEIGREGITYWENKIKEFSFLSKEEAIKMLIKSQKIEQKIQTIERAISKEYII